MPMQSFQMRITPRQTRRDPASLGRLAAALLDRAAHEHQAVARTGDAAVNQNQILLRDHSDDLLAEHADRLVAVLTWHLHAELHATRGHVGTDRATVTAILVSTVGARAARKVMATHDAGEAAALGRALHVHELTGLEQLIDLQVRADFDTGGELSRATELTQRTARRDVGLLEGTGERLVGVLLFELTRTDDDGIVAIFLLGALADHADVGFDDGARHDAAVLREDLSHADFAADDAGELIHSERTFVLVSGEAATQYTGNGFALHAGRLRKRLAFRCGPGGLAPRRPPVKRRQ